MSDDSRKIRFRIWYDFRNAAQWRQPADRLYREILDQIAWRKNNGFDDVWLSEHHFIEDGYLSSILPIAAVIGARTSRIRIASGVLLMPFHNPIRLAEDIAIVGRDFRRPFLNSASASASSGKSFRASAWRLDIEDRERQQAQINLARRGLFRSSGHRPISP
jgi:hypothetical protein